jgi:hypothetical protein
VAASAQLRACALEKTGLLVYALIHEALTNRAINRESGFNSAVKRRSSTYRAVLIGPNR